MCCSAKEFFNLDPICDVRSWLLVETGRWHHLPETFGPTSLNGLHLTSKVAHCCGEDGNEVGVHDWLPSDVDGMPFTYLPPKAPIQTQNEILGGLTRSKHFRIAIFEHKQIHLFELVGNLHVNTKLGYPGLFPVEIPNDKHTPNYSTSRYHVSGLGNPFSPTSLEGTGSSALPRRSLRERPPAAPGNKKCDLPLSKSETMFFTL